MPSLQDSSESDDQKVHELESLKVRRTRAAPFFNELMPGWRARARDIVPSSSRRNSVGESALSARDAAHLSARFHEAKEDDVSCLEELLRFDEKGGSRNEAGRIRERSQDRVHTSSAVVYITDAVVDTYGVLVCVMPAVV